MKYTNTEAIDSSFLRLSSEMRNERTLGIDRVSTVDMMTMLNQEDRTIADSVSEAIPQIADAVDLIARRMEQGGRMIYMAAGTSARVAFVDSSECPPTFHVKDGVVTCLMAGGRNCVFKAKENMEDSEQAAINDLIKIKLTERDTVVAASSSGRTPYCISGLKYAASIGAGRVSIGCNRPSEMSSYAEVAIEVETGAEPIMGSTRMKAGTAQKMIMNMLSTGVMIKLGRTYDNLQVSGEPENHKVNSRAPRRFAEITGNPDLAYAAERIRDTDGCLRCAIVRELTGCGVAEAKKACRKCDGSIKKAIALATERKTKR